MELRNVIQALYSRKLARTGTSKTGIPRETPGDHVVVLHSCRAPVVLRRLDDVSQFQVLGDCYIEGIMFAEGVVWD